MKTKLLRLILIGLIVFTIQGFGQEMEFTLQQTLCPESPDENRQPRIADVDNDGDLDIMLSRLYLNDGSGYFTPTNQVFGHGVGQFGYFNGDEYIDYFYSGYLYLNDPNNPGTFIYKSTTRFYADIILVRDFNENGFDDIVVLHRGRIFIYINNGDGTFTRTIITVGRGVDHLTAGDIDGDGDIDLISGEDYGREIYLFENNGQGSFIMMVEDLRYYDMLSMHTYDINGDGYLDIVIINRFIYVRAEVFYGDGNFGFSTGSGLNNFKTKSSALSEFRDYDGDGDFDALSTAVYLNDGNLRFSYAGGGEYENDGIYAAWGDFDGDGYLDMVNGNVGNVYFSSGLDLNEAPVAQCKDITIEADENCQAYITPEDIDNGSYDPDEGDEITLSLNNSGPFGIGTHNVELIVTDQDGATDSCFARVEVYANPTGVSNYIQELPDNYFDKNADQRKKVFKSKFDSIQKLIDNGNYQEAIDKLKNDIRKKVDGKNKNAWIIDPTAQAALTAYIDSMIEYLTGLL